MDGVVLVLSIGAVYSQNTLSVFGARCFDCQDLRVQGSLSDPIYVSLDSHGIVQSVSAHV